MAAQVHLVLNHFPVVTLLLALLVWAWGIVFKKMHIRHVAMGLLLLGGVLAGPAYFSGEEAEEQMEEILAAEEPYIEEHGEAAKLALAVALAAAATAATFFILRRARKDSLATSFEFVSVGVGLIAFLLVARAAHFGGMIRHPEVRGTQVTDLPPSTSPEEMDTEEINAEETDTQKE